MVPEEVDEGVDETSIEETRDTGEMETMKEEKDLTDKVLTRLNGEAVVKRMR